MSRVEELYRLSPMQQGVLFDCLAAEDSGRYLLQLEFAFEGDLDEELFEEAWRRVVAHYPVLRTSIHWEDVEEAVQAVRPLGEWRIRREDWRLFDKTDVDRRLSAFLAEDRDLGMDLRKSPLMRLCLIRTGERSRRLIWSFHHIVLEGWSASLVLRSVHTAYRTLSEGLVPTFDPAPSYRDFVAWTRRSDDSSAEQFWVPRLAGAASTDLPTLSGARGTIQAAESKTCQIVLSEKETGKLREFARSEGLTLNTVVQGAWALVLGQYAESGDVLFGAVSAGRSIPLEGVESLVGVSITVVPVRLSIDRSQRLRPWLKNSQAAMFDALRHEHVPLTKYREWIGSSGAGIPFDSLFVFENWSGDISSQDWFGGVTSERLRSDEGESGFPLTLEVAPERRLLMNLRYDPDRYADQMASAALTRLSSILLEMARHPEGSLGDIVELRGTELRDELARSSGPKRQSEGATVHGLFERQVDRTPNAVALTTRDGNLTYDQMNRLADSLAAMLIGRGVYSEAPVAICLGRSQRFVVAVLAILKAGGCYVPLDPDYPVERLQFIVDDCGARLIITEAGLVDTVKFRTDDVLVWEKFDVELKLTRELSSSRDVAANQAAYVLYTSGSTGKPKGVVVEHRRVAALVLWGLDVFDATELSRMLLSTSFCFDPSVFELFAPLSCGGRAVLVQNALELGEASWASTITFLNTVPSALRALLDSRDVPSSTIVVGCCGERFSAELADRVYEETEANRVVDFYGPTEDTVYSTWVERRQLGPESIGRPITNTRAYLLDESLRLTPSGAAGDLCLAGDGLARGYLDRADITADAFLPDPYSDCAGARMYRTGDRARRHSDGNLEFLGRGDRQVKFRGFRIELQEIEAALLEVQALTEVVVEVDGIPPDTERLVAYVASTSEVRPTEESLKRALRFKLPGYMVPSAIAVLDSLPRTPNGKIDRDALRQSEEDFESVSAETVDGPVDELEQQLVRVWKNVLGVSVGRQDDFFVLGGHSLAGVRLLAEVERATGRRLPLATLFQAPTIERMAATLRDDGWTPPWTSLTPIQPGGSRPPFYCVHGLGGNVMFYRQLAVELGSDQPFYGVQAIGLDGITPPFGTVEAMAEHYVEEIRNFQPEGPYYLGGFCFGAYVALEIAQRLVADGQRVALLASIDTDGGWRRISSIRQSLQFHLENLAHLGWKRRAAYLYQRLYHRGHRISNSFNEMVAASLQARGRPLSPTLRETRIWEANLAASRSYRPAPYPGKLTYFQSELDRHRTTAFWDEIITGGVEVHRISTREPDLLSPPSVALLAKALRVSIDDAFERESHPGDEDASSAVNNG